MIRMQLSQVRKTNNFPIEKKKEEDEEEEEEKKKKKKKRRRRRMPRRIRVEGTGGGFRDIHSKVTKGGYQEAYPY